MEKYIAIIQHVYENYLKMPYTNQKVKMDWNIALPDGTILERPNHALAHTLRVCMYIPHVITILNRINPSFHQLEFTNETVEKLQLAMLFAVTGRQNDGGRREAGETDYQTFRELSSLHFEECFTNDFKGIFTKDEVEYYKNLLFSRGSKEPSDVNDIIVTISHNMDHVRCFSKHDMSRSLNAYIEKQYGPDHQDAIELLLQHASRCVLATGDRLFFPEYVPYDLVRFANYSKNPASCIEAIKQVDFLMDLVVPSKYIAEEPIHLSSSEPASSLSHSSNRTCNILNYFSNCFNISRSNPENEDSKNRSHLKL